MWDFQGQIWKKNLPISGEFCMNLCHKLHQKTISKKRPILWEFSGQISLEINRFCADQTSVFNAFFNEIIVRSFNNNTFQKMRLTSWLVPSFLQHNLRLVVFGHCLLISVMRFQDKFARLRHVNSPNS